MLHIRQWFVQVELQLLSSMHSFLFVVCVWLSSPYTNLQIFFCFNFLLDKCKWLTKNTMMCGIQYQQRGKQGKSIALPPRSQGISFYHYHQFVR
jgi:hypothetical protein